MKVMYGGAPVPWTVAWTDEDQYWIGDDPVFRVAAVMQNQAQGKGRPRFSEPNVVRQREAHGMGLCDLCAKSLSGRTKIAFTNSTVVEPPMQHQECARISLAHCPNLRDRLKAGTLGVRRVQRYQVNLLSAAVPEAGFVGAKTEDAFNRRLRHLLADYHGPEPAGVAVVELLDWKDVTQEWLNRLEA